MCAKPNCDECQGELVAPICIELESEKYCTLADFTPDVEKRLTELEKPHGIDIKTLSPDKKLSRDAIIQILINEIIALKAAQGQTPSSGSTNPCPGIDWKNNCPSCNTDFCNSLQTFINTITLKTS
jgi:hypothetical protein